MDISSNIIKVTIVNIICTNYHIPTNRPITEKLVIYTQLQFKHSTCQVHQKCITG